LSRLNNNKKKKKKKREAKHSFNGNHAVASMAEYAIGSKYID